MKQSESGAVMSWLAPALVPLVLAMLTLAARSAVPGARPGYIVVLQYHWSFRLFGLIGLVVLNALVAASYLRAPEPKPVSLVALLLISAVVSALPLLLIWETFGVQVLVSETEIIARTKWRGSKVISWSDVAEIKYSAFNRWWIVCSKDGTKLHISQLLIGVSRFCEIASAKGSDKFFAPPH